MREIARRTGLNPSTVSRHLKKNKPEEEKKSTGGRPTKLSARIIKQFLRLVEAGHLKNATDIAEFILSRHSIKVTKWTIARILKSHGFKSYAKPKKPRLTQKHKKARRNFALIMSKLPEERWKTVVFTDESKICAFGPDGNKRVWRLPRSRLLDHHITPTVKFGGVSVMIWGAITYQGVGELKFIETRMDSEQYVDILKTEYAQTLSMHNLDIRNTIFQQDNDPKHVSRYTKNYLRTVDMKWLIWPSCSPDMNPIEHVWSYLKKAVSLEPKRPSNIDDLKLLIKRIWDNIPLDYIQTLYHSMPNRINKLLKAKGGYTKY